MHRLRAPGRELRAAGQATRRAFAPAAILAALAILAAAGPAKAAPAPAATSEEGVPPGKAAAKVEPPPWAPERRVTGPAGPAWPGLPIVVTVTYRNTLSCAARVPDWWTYNVTVRKAGAAGAAGPAQALWVRAASAPCSQPVLLGPGESRTRTALAVVGRLEDSDTSPPLLLFPEAGRYAIEGDGWGQGGPLEVTIEEPQAPDDRAARGLWTADVAACLVGDAARLSDALPAAERICTQYPLSRYAGYALYLRAEHACRRGDPRDRAEAAHGCEVILERHPEVLIRDRVLALLAVFSEQVLQRQRAREAAGELSRLFPASDCLADLRRANPVLFAAAAAGGPPDDRTPAAVTLSVSGLEAVPEGPRRTLEAFLQAAAQGRLDAIEALLARDFMGDFGPRSQYAEKLRLERRGIAGGEMRVAVRKAAMVPEYRRLISLPRGEQRTWHGPVCLVEGAVSARWAPDRPGNRLDAPEASWALYEYPRGTWKVISETCPTRNLAAGAMGQRLMRDLPRTLTAWKVTDGTRERRPYEEIKQQARLGGPTLDQRTEWRTHSVTAVGKDADEILLTGRVRLLLEAGAADPKTEQWVEREVRMHLVLGDGGSPVLRELTSTAVPLPAGGPGQR
ncbi:MAG: hypothetical protein IMZ44_00440 [Planctomycetes bacterium]|nr:hypothetical protein [Planctomycetota bacterium]